MNNPSLLARVLRSLHDGSFPIRVVNRFSHGKCGLAPEAAIDRYVAEHYPGGNWRSLSPSARKAWVQFYPVFDNCDIHTIAYVGANEGTTALALDEAFPGVEFLLLEPAPETFQILVRNAANSQNMCCLNIAAGAEEGWSDMFVDSYSPASSLLPYESVAIQEYPFLGEQASAKVHVRPLDDIVRDCEARDIDLLLMDVQGYEDKVLQGASQTLESCKVVISELSLQALYVDSSTFDSVYQALVREGFRLRYLINPMVGKSHHVLQIDGVFVRGQSETTGR